MSCRVFLSTEAEEQLRSADSWWHANRSAAPKLLIEEFEIAIGILEEMPEIGSPFIRATLPGVRRILLRRTGYWIYYIPDTNRSLVHVLALWNARRGSNPPLVPPGP